MNGSIGRSAARTSFLRRALLAAALGFGVAGSGNGQEDARLERSRELATALQQSLGARLSTAISAGGLIGAIDVCNVEAPEIAAGLSAGAGASVGRTSLRVRNPDNAPDEDARSTLERFELEWQRDDRVPPESFVVAADGGARYMRAIPTQALCVGCHGPALAADLAAAIAARYREDRATGFEVGTLRGAFLIDWPAQTQ
jgi:hypothetical protein